MLKLASITLQLSTSIVSQSNMIECCRADTLAAFD
jgi:hypothetical protein